MRNVLVVFVGSLLAGVVVLGGYVAGQRFFTRCPCGFVFSSQANGCIVDIYNQNPCTDPGGGRGPGGPGKPSGNGGPIQGPVNTPTAGCSLVVSPCSFTPDFRQATFNLWHSTGGPVAGQKVRMQIQSVEQSTGTRCNQVGGIVDFPSGTPTMMIPVDAVQAVTAFPTLKGLQKDNCVGSQFSMSVYPEIDPACGCKLTALKP